MKTVHQQCAQDQGGDPEAVDHPDQSRVLQKTERFYAQEAPDGD